ncbi:MAG TPA: Lar family restriction alleviation protein [Candidatus Gemmiger excrementavium]|uniref:Lar family restriction alleviation protein n=1 Tax=Candidatus Gemmiger excrementavium TaxID=2838608 RepID=A0A9D2F0M8_9FIRM|nr:Lar family restriction alleviation protein [Candidatus Gemmiger excrementavium]
MTDIEIRALLGDMRSQEECTRKRILLPCWRCGGEAEVKQVSTVGQPLFAVSCKKHYCGAYGCAHRTEKEAILYWNTRPVPPLGRCVECANSPDIETRSKGMRWCRNFRSEVKPDGFCNSFAAKE